MRRVQRAFAYFATALLSSGLVCASAIASSGNPPAPADNAQPASSLATTLRCDGSYDKTFYSGDTPFTVDLPVSINGGEFNPYCVLRSGARDSNPPGWELFDAVSKLQYALKLCNGASNLRVDGIYGPATVSAVKAAQKRGGVTQDGVYGPNTRAHMKWWVRPDYGQGWCGFAF
jgi:hypothetical protein